jgi:transposase
MQAFATAENNLRLAQRAPEKGEPNKAIACYGAVCDETKERFFCFADGQPNSEKSIAFLSTLLTAAKERNQRVLVVIWDRASWHLSKKVVRWLRQHNRQAKQEEQGVRLLACLLPSKSPWLNPMEPIWLHAKRKVIEADGELSVKVLKERLCALFHRMQLSMFQPDLCTRA